MAFGHGGLDWREDYTAYLSIRYDLTNGPVFPRNLLIQDETSLLLDMAFFKEKLSVLTGHSPFNYQNKNILIKERKSTLGLYHARLFLKNEYESLGFTVSDHNFSSGVNFIAEKLGKKNPEKVLILSSHLDSKKNPGANDDGTGTIGALTIAKELSKTDHDYTLRVIAFDKEEESIAGSDAYAAAIRDRKNIIGNINIEMIGHHSKNDGAFHIIDCGRKDSLFLSNAIKDSIKSLNLSLNVVYACSNKSDHGSFWRRGIPAVVLSENFFGGDADPCYHASCDVMDDRLNYKYMENILTATLDAVKKLLNP